MQKQLNKASLEAFSFQIKKFQTQNNTNDLPLELKFIDIKRIENGNLPTADIVLTSVKTDNIDQELSEYSVFSEANENTILPSLIHNSVQL